MRFPKVPGGRDPTCQGSPGRASQRPAQDVAETVMTGSGAQIGSSLLCVGPRPWRVAVCFQRGLSGHKGLRSADWGQGTPSTGTVVTLAECSPCARQWHGLRGPCVGRSSKTLVGGGLLSSPSDRRWGGLPTGAADVAELGGGFQSHGPSCLSCLQITGPWRSLWIRFGYDPRKHPEAKIYQVLDFRIRCGMKYGKSH